MVKNLTLSFIEHVKGLFQFFKFGFIFGLFLLILIPHSSFFIKHFSTFSSSFSPSLSATATSGLAESIILLPVALCLPVYSANRIWDHVLHTGFDQALQSDNPEHILTAFAIQLNLNMWPLSILSLLLSIPLSISTKLIQLSTSLLLFCDHIDPVLIVL